MADLGPRGPQLLQPFETRGFRLQIGIGVHRSNRESRFTSGDGVGGGSEGVTVGNFDAQGLGYAVANLGLSVFRHVDVKAGRIPTRPG